MTHDPLESLLCGCAGSAVDEARRCLAECLRIEGEAAAAVAAIEAAIERETEVATSLAAGDAEVEAFAAWLRRIRPKQQAALAAETGCRGGDGRSPCTLLGGRTGGRAGGGGDCWNSTPLAAEAEAERRAQGEIDEIAQHGEPIAQK